MFSGEFSFRGSRKWAFPWDTLGSREIGKGSRERDVVRGGYAEFNHMHCMSLLDSWPPCMWFDM